MLSATNQVTRMLINATQPEELRVAIVKGASLEVLDIERNGKQKRKGGIYLARVRRIEPSLNAAFVEYGGPNERDGFLPLKEVAPKYYRRQPVPGERFTIRDALEPGQEIIVQVDKSERGNKGAALSTYLSLPGPFLVLMSDNENGGGVSRRIASNHRVELREKLDNLEVREGMSVIIRTAGMGRTPEELRWDLKVLMAQYDAIQLAAKERPCPFLIYHEGDVVLRAIRDYLWQDIQEILIDEPETYQRAHQYLSHFRPDYLPRLRLYNDKVPLFVRYQIEQQVTTAFLPEVRLENGASIVIDACEALVAIDVNSGKATEGSDIEDTALKSNLAAAREIARQLRLRDIGGLIVIDFIDMTSPRSQRQVEQVLMEALSVDRARVQVGRISKFGLLEMSRQRLQPSLEDAIQEKCPRCQGHGRIRNIPSLSLAILRIAEEECLKEGTAQLRIQVPIEVAAFLLNEKRSSIQAIEARHNCHVVILPNPHMDCPGYEIERIRKEELKEGVASYEMVVPKEAMAPSTVGLTASEVPAMLSNIRTTTQSAAHPMVKPERGLIQRIWSAVFGPAKPTTPVTPPPAATPLRNTIERTAERADREEESPRRRHPSGRPGAPQRRNPRDDNRETQAPREREQREVREPREARPAAEPRVPRTTDATTTERTTERNNERTGEQRTNRHPNNRRRITPRTDARPANTTTDESTSASSTTLPTGMTPRSDETAPATITTIGGVSPIVAAALARLEDIDAAERGDVVVAQAASVSTPAPQAQTQTHTHTRAIHVSVEEVRADQESDTNVADTSETTTTESETASADADSSARPERRQNRSRMYRRNMRHRGDRERRPASTETETQDGAQEAPQASASPSVETFAPVVEAAPAPIQAPVADVTVCAVVAPIAPAAPRRRRPEQKSSVSITVAPEVCAIPAPVASVAAPVAPVVCAIPVSCSIPAAAPVAQNAPEAAPKQQAPKRHASRMAPPVAPLNRPAGLKQVVSKVPEATASAVTSVSPTGSEQKD